MNRAHLAIALLVVAVLVVSLYLWVPLPGYDGCEKVDLRITRVQPAPEVAFTLAPADLEEMPPQVRAVFEDAFLDGAGRAAVPESEWGPVDRRLLERDWAETGNITRMFLYDGHGYSFGAGIC